MASLTVTEQDLHRAATQFIRLNWPHAIFNSDGAGNNLSPAQAAINASLRSGRGFPDVQLLVPCGPYHGAFWELKRPGSSPYLRDGSLSTNPHVQEQAEVLQQLMNLGYYANFAVGIDDFIEQITWYMAH